MEQPQQGSEDKNSTLDAAEVSMEPQMIQETSRNSGRTAAKAGCAHQRLIDDVLTRGRKQTGKVRCLECGTIFDDPYEGSR